jgi:hypothetical protein
MALKIADVIVENIAVNVVDLASILDRPVNRLPDRPVQPVPVNALEPLCAPVFEIEP